MNWEAIGAIGEIVGALAVVLSLVYLARQIRHNTRQVEEQCRTQRQTGMLGARSAFTEWRSLVIQDPAVAAIWRKGSQSLELLDEDERTRFDLLLIDFFWAFATLWMQLSEGLVGEYLWEEAGSGNPAFYAGPGVRDWWSNSRHRGEYPAGFAKHIDAIFEARSDDDL